MKKALCVILCLLTMVTSASAAGFGQPQEAALVVSGSEITNGKGFLKNFTYLTAADMNTIASAASGESTYRLGLGDCFTEGLTYSTYENHGEPTWIYRRVYGLDLKVMAHALGIDTSKPMSITATSSDGMSKTLTDAFGAEAKRYSYDVNGQNPREINPILALFETTSETHELGKGVLPQLPALGKDSSDRTSLVFGYGQTAVDEVNSCYWVKQVNRLRFGTEAPALTFTSGGKSKTASLSSLVAMGIWNAEFGTVKATGLPLTSALEFLETELEEGWQVTVVNSSGMGISLTAHQAENAFLAWSATNSGSAVANSTSLRLYTGDGQELADVTDITTEPQGSISSLLAETIARFIAALAQHFAK